MWCNDKAQLVEENMLERQSRAQGLLKQVKEVYDSYFEDKEVSEKNFEKWLVNQVNIQEPKITDKKEVSTIQQNDKTNEIIPVSTSQPTSLKTLESRSQTKMNESKTKLK